MESLLELFVSVDDFCQDFLPFGITVGRVFIIWLAEPE